MSPFNPRRQRQHLRHLEQENNLRIRAFIGPEFRRSPSTSLTIDVVTASLDPILPERLYFGPIGSMKQKNENPDERC